MKTFDRATKVFCLLIAVSTTTTACVGSGESTGLTDDENADPTVEEQSVPESYVYKGVTYTDLKDLKVMLGGTDFSAVGVEHETYVFDTQAESLAFETRDVPHLLASNPTSNATASQPKVAFKLSFFDNANYGGSQYVLYKNATLDYSYHWNGYILTNNVFSGPVLAIAGKVSSFKAEYVTTANIDTGHGPTPLAMDYRLYTGDQQNGPFWEGLLTPVGTTSKVVPDLTKYRMWKAFGIVTWNDQIHSWKVQFN